MAVSASRALNISWASEKRAWRAFISARDSSMLARVAGRIDTVHPGQVTPLAAPLMLEMGRVPVEGAGRERMAEAAAARLMEAAGLV